MNSVLNQQSVHPLLRGEQLDHHVAHKANGDITVIAIDVLLVAGKHKELTGADAVFHTGHDQRQAALEHKQLLAPAFKVWVGSSDEHRAKRKRRIPQSMIVPIVCNAPQ